MMHEYITRPFFQVIVFTLLSIVILPIARPKDANSVYTIAGIVYAVFIVVNSIIICFVPKMWPYFFYSMLFSIVYVLATAVIMSLYIDITKTEGSGETAMIFLIIMYHPLASLLVIFLKWAYLKIF